MTAILQGKPKVRRSRPAVAITQRLPDGMPSEPVCRITVDQYHDMIRLGILVEGDPIELLEGWLVRKMPKNPPHVVSGKLLRRALAKIIPRGWEIQSQDPITLGNSEPEPDLAVVADDEREYLKHHPTAADVALVVEIADSSLARDKGWKKRVYARAGISQYWVVNLVDSIVEVFSDPNGSTKTPDFRSHQVFDAKQKLPVVLNGKKIGTILVSDVLP